MRAEICICAEIDACRAELPPIRTRVLILMHHRERDLTTNTGRLAELSLPNCEVRLRGERDTRLNEEGLREGKRLLLYPSDDAKVLDAPTVAALGPGPLTLIVPDGSWRQASKVAHREAALHDVPRVVLAPDAPTRYRLRREPKPDGLATFEAIARALGALEGLPVRARLEGLFDVMVERTLRSRAGVLAKD